MFIGEIFARLGAQVCDLLQNLGTKVESVVLAELATMAMVGWVSVAPPTKEVVTGQCIGRWRCAYLPYARETLILL